MDKYIVAGIDEAGRGPVIGPMVIACVAMERDSLSELVEMGLRDSKTLSKTKREFLVHRIGSIAKAILVEVVEPREIDSAVERRKYRSLNDLESNIVARLITRVKIPVKVFYVDSPDIKPAR
ncbi:MAG: ribonuclease HII, partial [Thermoprotei archaeon]